MIIIEYYLSRCLGWIKAALRFLGRDIMAVPYSVYIAFFFIIWKMYGMNGVIDHNYFQIGNMLRIFAPVCIPFDGGAGVV